MFKVTMMFLALVTFATAMRDVQDDVLDREFAEANAPHRPLSREDRKNMLEAMRYVRVYSEWLKIKDAGDNQFHSQAEMIQDILAKEYPRQPALRNDDANTGRAPPARPAGPPALRNDDANVGAGPRPARRPVLNRLDGNMPEDSDSESLDFSKSEEAKN